jgi:hypothetical protein
MPPRFNLFQDVVAIIERHKAVGTVVEESVEFVDRDTGEKREVDVTVTGTVEGVDVLVALEAADRSRRADVTWVEQQIAKHSAIATDQLVLVAARGFTKAGLAKAAAHGVVTITPQDLDDCDHEFAVLSKLTSPPVTIKPRLTGVVLDVRPPAGMSMVDGPDAVRRADGTRADLDRIAQAIFYRHFEGFLMKVAADLAQPGPRNLAVGEPPPEPLFGEGRTGGGDAAVLVPVIEVHINVSVEIQAHPGMTMVAALLADTAALDGETTLGTAHPTFVATDRAGKTQATLRTREPGEREPVDWTFDGAIDIE